MSQTRSVTLAPAATESGWITPYPGARAVFITSGDPDSTWPASQTVKIQLRASEDADPVYAKDADGNVLEFTDNTVVDSIPDVEHRLIGENISQAVVLASGSIANQS